MTQDFYINPIKRI